MATIALLTLTGFFLPGVIQETEYVNPLGIEALETFDQGVPGFALVVILVLCIVASAVSVVVRYRTAVGSERLQLKWMMAAGVVAAVAYALLFVWDDFDIQLVWALIPIAIGLSMHRHHLYDIDRLISRTIVYAVVVGALAIVFASVIFVLQEVSPFQDDLAVAASTSGGGRGFQPGSKQGPGAGGPSDSTGPATTPREFGRVRHRSARRDRLRPDRGRLGGRGDPDHAADEHGHLVEARLRVAISCQTRMLISDMNRLFAHTHHHHHPSWVG